QTLYHIMKYHGHIWLFEDNWNYPKAIDNGLRLWVVTRGERHSRIAAELINAIVMENSRGPIQMLKQHGLEWPINTESN
ncbi:unnamed protein product, partial [marine sediment metagenome]